MSQDDDFLQSLRATFAIEAEEHLQTMAAGLLSLEPSQAAAEPRPLVETVFRAAHSLKGASRAVNATDIELICQKLEDLFARWKRQKDRPSQQDLDQAHRSLDAATKAVAKMRSPSSASSAASPPTLPPPAPPKLETPADVHVAPAPPPPSAPAVNPPAFESSQATETVRIPFSKLDARLLEAEEMLTAKLTAGQRVAEMRDLVTRLDEWKRQWNLVEADVRTLRHGLGRSASALESSEAQGLNRLLEFIDWNHDYLRSLENSVISLGRTATHDYLNVGKLVDDLLTDSKKLVMLPAATLQVLLSKLVRDLCRDQGKEAEFVLHGGEVEIDKRILDEMKDPLIHLLRNSVDHGLESPAQRQQAHKPARATIALTVSRVNGSKVELMVTDDGRGIDVQKVKSSAVSHGLVEAADTARMTEAEALALIFKADVSTSPIITQLSGRGLGLAIVREKAEKLGGTVTVETRPGQGTVFRITLPATMATFRGILVTAAGRTFVVPTAQVRRVFRFQPEQIQTVEGRETLSIDNKPVALARLAEVLELPPATTKDSAEVRSVPALLIGSEDESTAFAVDSVVDEQEILAKQLGKPLARVRNIAGATVLGSGQVAPILNVADLLKSARRGGLAHVPADSSASASKAKTILVAEDSITSRMLLRGILETAGYTVKTAVDGMEAFSTLRATPFDLVVSDVEMPRLNGFDLIARIRADRKLSEVPVILVTALETREDRERGIDVGANAYLVKSGLDQGNLLEAVARLI